MAIALDGTVASYIRSGSTETKSVVVASNENRLLIVSYATYQGGGPTSMTYNGSSLTKIVEKVGSFSEQCSIWGIIAPDTGTHDLVINGAGNWSSYGIYSLYNCDQTLPSNTATAQSESSTASCALTTVANNSWIITCIESEPDPTMTTTNGVADWEKEGASYQHGSGQHVVKATAGSHTMSASLTYGARWNQANIEVKEVGSAVKTINSLARASVKTVDNLAIASVKTVNGLA